jgi:HEAT repeat protein
MTWAALKLAAALVGCSEAVVLAALDIALLRSIRRRRGAQAAEAILPEMRSVLVDHLAGADKREELRGLLDRDSAALTEAIFSFRGAVAGVARERLCELSQDLGLVHEWCGQARSRLTAERRQAHDRLAFVSAYEPCRRIIGDIQLAAIEDPDGDVRISAARGLIQAGEADVLDRVFEFAVSANVLTRAALAADLRRYAAELSQAAIPAALSSPDDRIVLAALDVLVAWECAVIIPDFDRLLEHSDRSVRLQAFRLAPLVPLTPEVRSALVKALQDSDSGIAAAAALSAGRLRIGESLPRLSELARESGVEVARTAAAAMATMPPEGWKALEEMGRAGNNLTAQIARAALTRVRGKAWA